MTAAGCAIEQNTDRISAPAGVMSPSVDILRRARERGTPLVISSDAHEAQHVGRLWDESMAPARDAGYRESLRLSDRALVPLLSGTGRLPVHRPPARSSHSGA